MKKKKEVSFKEYVNIAWWSLRVSWGVSPYALVGSLITEVIRNLRSIVNTYVFAKLIDKLVILATTDGSDVRDLIPFLLILLGINIFFSAIDELRGCCTRMLRRLSGPYLDRISYEQVNYLGSQTLELPDVANAHQKMKDWLGFILEVGANVLRMISASIKTIVSGVIIFKTVPVIIPMVLSVSFIFFLQRRYFFKKEFEWQTNDDHVTQRRKCGWIAGSLADPRDLGEISITGAFGYLNKRFVDFFKYYNSGLIKIMKSASLGSFIIGVIGNVVLLIGYFQVFALLVLRKISIGDTTFFMSTIDNFYDGIEYFFDEVVVFRDFVMKAREVYRFFHLDPSLKDGDIEIPRFEEAPLIEIKNMSFHYPNDKRDIFKNFSLKIMPGEKIAIVGENGAGKTTLVKLLSRIYDPQDGDIFVNGVNLKDIKLNDWYKNIGVLFQDYNFYGELNAEENIYMGKSVKPLDREKIIEAAKNADAHEFIMKYKDKYKTVMSERFRGGIRPSNGQRQKIAIARFFYRNAPVAIFDEPTSAIDAESEYRIFNRIYEFFNNKSVLIISHRFSTVRNADKIVVLDGGKIIEEGTHSELMSKKGKYHSAFTKQAEGYTKD